MSTTESRFESNLKTIANKYDVSVKQTVMENISPREPDQYAVLTVEPGTVDAVPADLLVEVSDRGLSVVEVRRTGDIGLGIKVAPQADRSN